MPRLDRFFSVFSRKDSVHVEVRGLSSDYLEGNLPSSLGERVRTHLEKCGPCTAFVNGLSATIRMLSDLGNKEPPPKLKSHIIQRVDQDRKKHS